MHHNVREHFYFLDCRYCPLLTVFREFGYLRDYPSTPKSGPRFGASLSVDGGVGGVIHKDGAKEGDDESFDNESGIGRSRAG